MTLLRAVAGVPVCQVTIAPTGFVVLSIRVIKLTVVAGQILDAVCAEISWIEIKEHKNAINKVYSPPLKNFEFTLTDGST
jgi:hypothetical protein